MILKILSGPRTASVACRHGLWMMQIGTWAWSHTCWDHMVLLIGHQVCKWVQFYIPIGLQLFKLGEFYILSPSYNLTSDDLWPWYMTFDRMNLQRVPYCINKPGWVPIAFQLFEWGHFHIFSLSYNLTSDDLGCDLWLHQNEGPNFTFLAYLITWPQMTFDPMGPNVASTNQVWLKSIKAYGI